MYADLFILKFISLDQQRNAKLFERIEHSGSR